MKKSLFFLLFVCVGIFSSSPIYCNNSDKYVDLKIIAVYASNSKSENVNDKAEDIKEYTDELSEVLNFTFYKKLTSYNVTLSENRGDRIIIPGNNEMAVFCNEIKEESVKIHIDMGDFLNTDVLLLRDRHIIIGGPKYKNGNIIFIVEIQG